MFLGLDQFLHHRLGVSVGGVDDDGVGTGLHQRCDAVECVDGHAHTGSHTQAALVVLAGHGFVLGLGDVLIGDESHQVVVLVHHGQFLYLVLLQYLCSGGQVGLLIGSDEMLARHHLVDLSVEAVLKAEVAVGDDAHQQVVLIHHGNTADVILCHHGERLTDRASLAYGDGVVNHAVLGTFHDSHLASLFLNRHVFVYHADTALSCYRYGHGCLGHGIHGCSDKGDVEANVTGEPGAQGHRFGQHFRIGGN